MMVRVAFYRVCAVVGELRIEPSMKGRHKAGLSRTKR